MENVRSIVGEPLSRAVPTRKSMPGRITGQLKVQFILILRQSDVRTILRGNIMAHLELMIPGQKS